MPIEVAIREPVQELSKGAEGGDDAPEDVERSLWTHGGVLCLRVRAHERKKRDDAPPYKRTRCTVPPAHAA